MEKKSHSKATYKGSAAKTKALVLVDPAASGIPLIDYALNTGFRPVILVTLSQEAIQKHWISFMPFLTEKNETRSYDVIFGNDIEEIIFQLGALHYQISGFIAGSEGGVITADILAKKYGLPGNDITLSSARRNKTEMKWIVSTKGLRVAQHASCPSLQHAIRFAQRIEYPIILKTPASTGGELVFKCYNDEDVQRNFNTITTTADRFGVIPKAVLAEEFLQGTEYAINLFADGTDVQVTDVWEYRKTDQPDAEHIYCDIIQRRDTTPHIDLMTEYAITAAKALGIHYGPIHAEIMLTPTGPVMIEIASRLPGARIPSLIQFISDFNPYLATIEVFTSGKTTVPREITFRKHAWITCHSTATSGTIETINGLEKIKKLPGYLGHVLDCQAGETIPLTRDSFHIPLVCWFADESADQTRLSARIAHHEFRIEIRTQQDRLQNTRIG